MGTRAVYFFEDEREEVAVYKHYDNYPKGAVKFIAAAKEYAWELPRFEADEFGAAFVAANKNPKGGEVRLIAPYEDRDKLMEQMNWCDYYYVVSYSANHMDLWVTTYRSEYDRDHGSVWVREAEMPLDQMISIHGEVL